MKKIEYQAPEMEVFQMKYEKPLLDGSEYEAGGKATGHAPELGDIDE